MSTFQSDPGLVSSAWVPQITPRERARQEAVNEAAGNGGIGTMPAKEFEAMMNALPDSMINRPTNRGTR